MAKRRRRRKGRRHTHRRKKHPLPASFVSGIVYAIAAIVCLSVGALIYKGVKEAEKDMKPRKKTARSSSVAASHLPPGATVVKKRGKGGKTESYKTPREKAQTKKPAPQPRVEPAPPPVTAEPQPIIVKPEPMEPIIKRQPPGAPSPRPRVRPPWENLDISLQEPQIVTITPSADTTIYIQDATLRERNGGGLDQLRLDGAKSMILTSFDTAPIQGWSIRRAVWHAKLKEGQAEELSFSSVMARWEEGTGTLLKEASNGATYQWSNFRRAPWTREDAPLPYVTRGNGNSLFRLSFPEKKDKKKDEWIKVEIPPELIQALVAGASYGIAITDERNITGDERLAFYSRETEDSHYLEIEGQLTDIDPPGQLTDFECFSHKELNMRGSVGVILRWTATGDDKDDGQAFRYEVRYTAHGEPFERATELPLHKTPYPPMPAGETDQVVINDLDPNTSYTFYVRAIDKAGQEGPISEREFTTTDRLTSPTLSEPTSYTLKPLEILNRSFSLQVLDEYVGMDPKSGHIASSLDESATPGKKSFLWERDGRALHLRGARNEYLGFILAVAKRKAQVPTLKIRASAFRRPNGETFEPDTGLFRVMPHHKGKKRQLHGDALTPLAPSILPPKKLKQLSELPAQLYYVDFLVPQNAEPGTYQSKLTFTGKDNAEDSINIFLTVLPIELPNRPSFTIELLGTPSISALYGKELLNTMEAGTIEERYHQLARKHRCELAILPYSPTGESPAPFCPPVSGTGLDTQVSSWGAWDERLSSYFNGSAFENMPQNTDPAPYVILPIFENWPAPLEENYRGQEWDIVDPKTGITLYGGPSDRVGLCMDHDYWRALRAVLRDFGSHFSEKNWVNTRGHVWLSNTPTNQYRGKAPPWALGAPRTRNDFLALQAYATSFADTSSTWPGQPPLFRVEIPDVSQLQKYGRGTFSLLTITDQEKAAWEALQERSQLFDETLWLQSDHVPFAPHRLAIPATAITYFLQGADGWTIRNVVGKKADWRRGNDQAILYTGAPWRKETPMPSLRLKALRRTQQDIELLLLLQKKKGWTRKQLHDFLQPYLVDQPGALASSADDWHKLRVAVQELLMR